MSLLRVSGLKAGYGGRLILDGIDLTVEAGEVVAMIGHNGAGKSTLLKALFNLVPVRSGGVMLDGTDISTLPPHRLLRAGLGYVPQDHSIFPQLSIGENMRMGAYLIDDPALYRKRLDTATQLFPELAKRSRQLAGTLSGGEQRLLEIARTLLMEPKVILLDEPSIGLAPRMVQTVLATARRLAERGAGILIVEQNVQAALRTADRACVLELGKIVLEDRASALIGDQRVARLYMGARQAS